jgi:hypothetical protein
MPLANIATLKSDILKMMNEPPENEAGAIEGWGKAISNWLGSAVIPPGAAAAKVQIETAVKGALVGMSAPGAGSLAIPNAFLAGAGALATSPANAPGVAVPPPLPLPLALGAPLEADPVATLIASTAASWFIAGTYTVPGASPVPWS